MTSPIKTYYDNEYAYHIEQRDNLLTVARALKRGYPNHQLLPWVVQQARKANHDALFFKLLTKHLRGD